MKGEDKFKEFLATRIALPVLQLICLLSSIQFAVYQIPEFLNTYTLVTSCEMLKDRKLIDEVVKDMKVEKTQRNFRVFKAMRLMRRDYMRMCMIDQFSEDGSGSDYGNELGSRPDSSVISEQLMLPSNTSQRRLKDITVKNILNTFRKIGY